MTPFRALGASSLAAITIALHAGCHGGDHASTQYEAYDCPAPIGRIVREDCAATALRYEGIAAGASAGVGPVSAGASYKDTAIREADDLIAVLKEQQTSLCQDFNTCKLSVPDYRTEKGRIDTTATMVLAIKGNVEKISADQAMALLAQIRQIRQSVGTETPAPSPSPSPEPAGVTTAGIRLPDSPPPATGESGSWGPGVYMAQAVARVSDAANNIQQKGNYGFDIDHACLLGAALQKGQIIAISQRMKAGTEYAILGGGSASALDVDVAVFDSAGKAIAADTDDDPTPAVGFTVPKDDMYTFKMQLAKASADDAFVAMALMQKGGYIVPVDYLVKAIKSVIGSAGLASAKVRESGAKGLVFHEGLNWSFYGSVLKPNEAGGLSNFAFDSDPAVFIAGGNDTATNIGMKVTESASSTVVGVDDGKDPTALVILHPQAGKRYGFSVINAATSATVLATAVVLDVVK